MIASSPGFMVASSALKINCFAPVPTMISSGRNVTALSRLNFSQMAVRNCNVPATAVYRVCPETAAW